MITLEGVREYVEGIDVKICETQGKYVIGAKEGHWPGCGRLVIVAYNESGCNQTEVDLLDLVNWLKANMPDLLKD